MTPQQLAEAIRTRFKQLVTDVVPVPTQHDNQGALYQGGTAVAKPSGLWCRATILEGQTTQASIGSPGANRERTRGVLVVQLFAPVDTGDKAVRDAAQVVRAAFKRITADGVVWQTPSRGEPRRDGGWWALTVSCPFYADTIG